MPAFVLDDPTPPDPRRRWDSLDAAARGACYDNNAGVPDSAAQVAARNAASATYRAAHPDGLDIPYAAGERTAFDLYPVADARAPASSSSTAATGSATPGPISRASRRA